MKKKEETLIPLQDIRKWIENNRNMMFMFNPMDKLIKAKWEGELQAYDNLLKRLNDIEVKKAS